MNQQGSPRGRSKSPSRSNFIQKNKASIGTVQKQRNKATPTRDTQNKSRPTSPRHHKQEYLEMENDLLKKQIYETMHLKEKQQREIEENQQVIQNQAEAIKRKDEDKKSSMTQSSTFKVRGSNLTSGGSNNKNSQPDFLKFDKTKKKGSTTPSKQTQQELKDNQEKQRRLQKELKAQQQQERQLQLEMSQKIQTAPPPKKKSNKQDFELLYYELESDYLRLQAQQKVFKSAKKVCQHIQEDLSAFQKILNTGDDSQ